VAARSKAWTVFACAVLCAGSGLAAGWSPVQGHLLTVYSIMKLNERSQVPRKGFKTIVEWMYSLCVSYLSAGFCPLWDNKLNPLKTETLYTRIKEFSSYLTGNLLCHRFKAQPVNNVQGNSRSLLWEPYATHTLCEQNAYNVYIKTGGTFSDHWTLKG
jgi:hypothetical protein